MDINEIKIASLKRYEQDYFSSNMTECEDGRWVKFEDVKEIFGIITGNLQVMREVIKIIRKGK